MSRSTWSRLRLLTAEDLGLLMKSLRLSSLMYWYCLLEFGGCWHRLHLYCFSDFLVRCFVYWLLRRDFSAFPKFRTFFSTLLFERYENHTLKITLFEHADECSKRNRPHALRAWFPTLLFERNALWASVLMLKESDIFWECF